MLWDKLIYWKYVHYTVSVLVKAQIDTHQREDANKTATSALQLSKKYVPNLYITTFKQLVHFMSYDIVSIDFDDRLY